MSTSIVVGVGLGSIGILGTLGPGSTSGLGLGLGQICLSGAHAFVCSCAEYCPSQHPLSANQPLGIACTLIALLEGTYCWLRACVSMQHVPPDRGTRTTCDHISASYETNQCQQRSLPPPKVVIENVESVEGARLQLLLSTVAAAKAAAHVLSSTTGIATASGSIKKFGDCEMNGICESDCSSIRVLQPEHLCGQTEAEVQCVGMQKNKNGTVYPYNLDQ
ncbi:unnamed protein product [Phytophthora fragariaefolia]|uniref:Unnamed protein product n=1 Tax=Phytophthora fragariaefolia TaxID=1490495 RepID=A0A9W6X854_9STRA|nr:unnamed protein product [Phytophthora fragariaefolia]